MDTVSTIVVSTGFILVGVLALTILVQNIKRKNKTLTQTKPKKNKKKRK